MQENVFWFDSPNVNVKIDVPVTVSEKKWWDDSEKDSIVYGNVDFLNKAKYKKLFAYKDMCRPLVLFLETVNICNLS